MKKTPLIKLETDWNKFSYPRLCGLLADRPTRLSQAMHNAGFQALTLPFFYCAFDTLQTEAALGAMRVLGMRGFSLTIPHKERGLLLVDELSDDAKRIGSINTVINNGSKLFGFNTDWTGIVESFGEAEIQVLGKKALVIGAGGAARAAVYALGEMGVQEIVVANRNAARASHLAADFGVQAVALTELAPNVLGQFDILVNSTPVGSKLGNPRDVPISLSGAKFHKPPVVFDMVTNDTPWLAQAKDLGAQTISGLRMLVFQAAEQFRLFTEQTAPLAALETALKEEIARP